MKIGIVTTWFERGAAYVSKQYMELLQPEHEVFIYARGFKSSPESPAWDGDNIHWGKKSVLPVAMAIDRSDFVQWIKNKDLEVVFFNEQQWWPPVLWARAAGVKTGAYIDYYTEETIPFFAAYDFLICNTRRHFEALDWHPQAFFIPWGTNTELFRPGSMEPVSDRPVFFQSCGYSPLRKGTDFVLEAFSRINAPASLVIHTQVDLIKAMPGQEKNIRQLLEQKRLQIINKTVSAPGLYYLGDVYVAPSRLEGIGLTAAEAIASGLPFITTDFPPMNEFVTEESGRRAKVSRTWARKDGYYWPQCSPDIESLKEQMLWYITHFDKIKDLKASARQYAEHSLDWSSRKQEVFIAFVESDVITTNQRVSERIASFERSKSGLRVKLAEKYPWLYRLIS